MLILKYQKVPGINVMVTLPELDVKKKIYPGLSIVKAQNGKELLELVL